MVRDAEAARRFESFFEAERNPADHSGCSSLSDRIALEDDRLRLFRERRLARAAATASTFTEIAERLSPSTSSRRSKASIPWT